MDFLASLFVAKPINILAVSLVFLAGYLLLRFSTFGAGKSVNPLLFATLAWSLYAAWEWLILVKTPEADIRADLLIIWPILAIVSLWALFRTFR